jgi:hypothetical protein
VALMARIVASTFAGAPPSEVVADASIYWRALYQTLGEMAEIKDRLTGENFNAVTINHTGSGRGCPLGLAIANQHIDARIDITNPSPAVADYVDVIAVPIFVATGEDQSWVLEVEISDPKPLNEGEVGVTATLFDSSWVAFQGPIDGRRTAGGIAPGRPINDGSAPPRTITDEQQFGTTALPTYSWNLTLSAGLQFLTVSRFTRVLASGVGGNDSSKLGAWRLYPARRQASRTGAVPSSSVGNNHPLPTTLVPGTWVEFDSTQVEESGPLDAYVISRANRNINALTEWMTGAPVAGNASMTMTTNRLGNRASFTSEPLIDLPIACVALGSSFAGGLKPIVAPPTLAASTGMLQWSRFPVTRPSSGSPASVALIRCILPNFSTASSLFKLTLLVQAPAGGATTLNDWRVTVSASGASGTFSFTRMGATNYWSSTITAIPFTAGSHQNVIVNLHHITPAAIDGDLIVLGAMAYFEAP